MATNFPTSIDSLADPAATDVLGTAASGIGVAAVMTNLNDAVEAIEAKVGVNSSAVTTSHDYKLSGVTGTDKAVSKTGTETLTNKTLTSPVLTTPQINDTSSDHQYIFASSELTADRTITLPLLTGNDDFVFEDHIQTLTNKRITKRVTTITSSATPTINTDNCDVVTITALAAAITSMTTNLSGTPTNFQTLIFRILDDGTGRAITWGAKFEPRGVALPTTTTANKLLTVGFIYDTVDSIWGCVASADET